MVNDEILTALKNAINHGESLDLAVNVMINSGYSPKDVNEAAQFLGQGATSYMQPKPDENLAMPSQKNFFGNIVRKPVLQQPPQQITPQALQSSFPSEQPQKFYQSQSQQQFQRMQTQKAYIQQNPNAIKQNISSGRIMPQMKNQTQQLRQFQQPQQPQQYARQQPQQYSYQTTQAAQSTYQPTYQTTPQLVQEQSQLQQNKEYPSSGYAKEIILLIILLILLGALIATILFKGKILDFIQTFQGF
ncbi:MAG: hypothetical protein AABX54_04600 [Nanoarchaeota archaeon]